MRRDRIWVESGSFALPPQRSDSPLRPYAWMVFPLYFAIFFAYAGWFLKSPDFALERRVPPGILYAVRLLAARASGYCYYGFKWCAMFIRYNPFSKLFLEQLVMFRMMPSFIAVCLVYRYFARSGSEDRMGILEGSAHWADKEEIARAGLLGGAGVYVGGWLEKGRGFFKKNRVIPLQHNGPEHVMAVAPTRSGKGVSLVVPTLLSWEHSVFVLDIKGENWLLSAGWRHKELGQPVLRFDPSDSSPRGAHYNPLEEIHFSEDGGASKDDEARDVQTIASLLVDPDGKGLEDHWAKTAFILLQGAILHMVYKGRREGRIYSLKDVRDCLTHGSNKGLATEWLLFPHLKKGWDIKSTNMWQSGWEQDRPTGFRSGSFPPKSRSILSASLNEDANLKEPEERHTPGFIADQSDGENFRRRLACAELERAALGNPEDTRSFAWEAVRPFIDEDGLCYTHPTAVAVATEIGNKDVREASSIISTAISFLGLWLDPVVEMNTARSTFHLRDLVDGEKAASLYLVVPPSGLTRLRPLLRLVVSQLVFSLTPPMVEKEDGSGIKSANGHRMLLLLDEFPTLAKLDLVQSALAYLGGYGVKTYIIIQSYKQLTDIYGQDETVSGNCHIHVAFAPNDESTAKALSERCGKTTIITGSSNISGKRFAMHPLMKDSESIQYAAHGRELLTPDECKRLPTAVKDSEGRMVKPGCMLTFAAGCAPIMGMQTPWFFDKEQTRRRSIRAPEESTVIDPVLAARQAWERTPDAPWNELSKSLGISSSDLARARSELERERPDVFAHVDSPAEDTPDSLSPAKEEPELTGLAWRIAYYAKERILHGS